MTRFVDLGDNEDEGKVIDGILREVLGDNYMDTQSDDNASEHGQSRRSSISIDFVKMCREHSVN